MKNLIGMTDFVLEQFEKRDGKTNDYGFTPISTGYDFDKCAGYAKFLKQPLELWMFVPCDEDGNVLDKYKYFPCSMKFANEINEYHIKYQQAKESCIFESNSLSLNKLKDFISEGKTIEFLIDYYYDKTKCYLETNKELF